MASQNSSLGRIFQIHLLFLQVKVTGVCRALKEQQLLLDPSHSTVLWASLDSTAVALAAIKTFLSKGLLEGGRIAGERHSRFPRKARRHAGGPMLTWGQMILSLCPGHLMIPRPTPPGRDRQRSVLLS